MKALVVVPLFPCGGAEKQIQYLQEYTEQLNDVSVDVLATDSNIDEHSYSNVFGLGFDYFGKPSYGRFTRLFLRIFYLIKIVKYLLISKYDVFVFYNKTFLPVAYALRIFNKPVVFSIREYDSRLLSGWRLLFLKSMSRVFCNSRRISDDLNREGVVSAYIQNFHKFNVSVKKRTDRCHSSYGVIVSNVEPHKNIDFVIRSISNMGYSLKVCGRLDNAEYLALCTNLAIEYDVDVEFLGYLETKELERIMIGSGFLIHPSKQEGAANSIILAVDLGLRVIASDIPENRDLLGSGCFFELGKCESLRNSIESIGSPEYDPILIRRDLEDRLGENNLSEVVNMIRGTCYGY